MSATICLFVLLLLILLILAILPCFSRREEMRVLQIAYAHRGLHDETKPENSMSAFRAAIAAGYGIECDMRLTADGIPVVFHDASLARMCGFEDKVSDRTLDDLRTLHLGNSDEQIPTLEELLHLTAGQVPLLIEIKGEDGNTEICAQTAELLDNYDGLFSIQSFNPLYLNWFRQQRPVFLRGLLYTDMFADEPKMSAVRRFALTGMLLNFLARPDYISYSHAHPNTFLLRICRDFLHTPCLIWTVRTPAQQQTCHPEAAIIFEDFIPE
ncbi:MAG: glycerophosphodiester phosphodiesterase [Clostridia bacterium]|nr:glycerophosphodiester phosphodiesterase [Clostridia bacterium]